MPKTKEPKISVNMLERIYEHEKKAPALLDYPLGSETVQILVKPFLTLEETVAFISDVVKECIDEQDTAYHSEFQEYMKRRCVIEYFTNIKLPKDHRKTYCCLMETGLYGTIESQIDNRQLHLLENAIAEKIGFIREQILKQSKLDDLIDLIYTIVSKLDDSLDMESINQLLSKLDETKFDEKALIDALVDSKMPSSFDGEAKEKIVDFPIPGQLDFYGNEVPDSE